MKQASEREQKIAAMREVGDRISSLDKEVAEVEAELNSLVAALPNIPDERTPIGASEEENVVLRTVGQLPEFDFEPKAHWDLGPALGILDFERGAKITGSRFYVLSGAGRLHQPGQAPPRIQQPGHVYANRDEAERSLYTFSAGTATAHC